jgi:hypothetical protein
MARGKEPPFSSFHRTIRKKKQFFAVVDFPVTVHNKVFQREFERS